MKEKVAVWKKIVDVQQHFNEILIKIRSLGITVLGAVLTAAAFAAKEHVFVVLRPFDVTGSVPMAALSLVTLALLYLAGATKWSLIGGAILLAGVSACAHHWTLVTVPATTVSAAVPILFIAEMTWGAFYLLDHLWYHRLLKGAVNQGLRLEAELKSAIPGIGLAEEISKHSPVTIGKRQIRSDQKIVMFYGAGAILVLLLLWVSLSIEVQTDSAKATKLSPGPAKLALSH